LQKVKAWANLKLASVVTDISGVLARAMLKALVTGTEDTEALAAVDVGCEPSKRNASECLCRGEYVTIIAFCAKPIRRIWSFKGAHLNPFGQRIEQRLEQQSITIAAPSQLAVKSTSADSPQLSLSWLQAMTLLDPIPEVARALRTVAACRNRYRYRALS
jgi:hypothetical protein